MSQSAVALSDGGDHHAGRQFSHLLVRRDNVKYHEVLL